MKKLLTLLLIFGLITLPMPIAYAHGSAGRKPTLFQEEDGSDASRYRVIKFPNGAITNNGDGSATIAGADLTAIDSNLIPDTDDTYDIGEIGTPLEWRNIFIDGVAFLDAVDMDVNQNITQGGETLDHDGTHHVFSDSVQMGGASAGQSTIASGLIVNDDSGATAADDFIAETANFPTAFQVDASADEIDIFVTTEIQTNNKLQFRDIAIGIYSQADTFMDLFADGAIRIGNSSVGAPTTYIIVEPDADTFWVGSGAGLGYGSLYLHQGASNVDITGAGTDVYVKITGLTTGLLNNVSINSDAFNVTNIGVYKINWQVSAASDGANLVYDCDIFLNGVEQNDGASRRKFGGGGDIGSFSGSAILDITNTGHDIDLRIEQVGGAAADINVFHMNFNIIQIGG